MPRYNPNDDRQLQKLDDAIEWSQKELSKYVKQYVENMVQYVGYRYGGNGTKMKMLVNMLRVAVDVWKRKLVTRAPAVLALTTNPAIKPRANELEIAMGHLFRKIDFAGYLQEVAHMGLMGFGAMKVGLRPTLDSGHPSYTLDSGQPYAHPILWEDWVHDMNARRRDEWDFVGNKYEYDYEELMENQEFDSYAKDDISADGSKGSEYELADGSENRSTISRTQNEWQSKQYRTKIELRDIWLPKENLLITKEAKRGAKPLFVREWEGPEHGPYHFLNFFPVPGNVLGSEPASLLYDMNDILNRISAKIARQGERQKTNTLVSAQAAGDGSAENIRKAQDGEMVNVTNPKDFGELNSGGVRPENMNLAIWLRQQASYMGGNLDLMGGLAAQSATAKQDSILAESSSEFVLQMQSVMESFTRGVCEDLGYYYYTDQNLILPMVKPIPGSEYFIPMEWGQEHRTSPYSSFEIQIQPYSLRTQTPEQRMQKLLQIVTQILGPLLPQLAQQGKMLNSVELLRLITKYEDLPELNDIIVDDPMMMMQQGGGGQPQEQGMPPNTERRYVRESRSAGPTNQARDNLMMQQLMSGGDAAINPQQMAQMGAV